MTQINSAAIIAAVGAQSTATGKMLALVRAIRKPEYPDNEWSEIERLVGDSTAIATAMGAADLGAIVLTLADSAELPLVQVGSAYSFQFAASGGVAPYTFSVDPGGDPMPSGMTLDSTGLMHGTPSAPVTIGTLRIKATDSEARSGSADLSWEVTEAPFANSVTLCARSIATTDGQITGSGLSIPVGTGDLLLTLDTWTLLATPAYAVVIEKWNGSAWSDSGASFSGGQAIVARANLAGFTQLRHKTTVTGAGAAGAVAIRALRAYAQF